MEIQLRVVLLGVGLLILLVVAFDLFRRKTAIETNHDKTPDFDRDIPRPEVERRVLLDDYQEPGLDFYEAAAAADTGITASEAPLVIDVEEEFPVEHLITISIMSRDPYGFDGDALLAAFTGANLEFGKNDIFHRIEEGEVLFSASLAVEPGYFILETLPQEHIPGVTLILLPEHVKHPVIAFDKMIRAAKQIAFALNGELLDHAREPLTLNTIEQYRRETECVTQRS